MKFSLVLATLGREGVVSSFLEGLRLQSYDNFEVIIVDQNQDDFIKNEVGDYKDLSINYVKTDKKGLSIARNIGLKYVTGDIIAFPDDDCVYHKDLLKSVLEIFVENTQYYFCAGSLRNPENNRYLSSINLMDTDTLVNFRNFLRTVAAATLFVRNSSYKLHFDEQFGLGAEYGSAEESDLVLTLLEKSFMGFFSPDKIIIYHPDKTFKMTPQNKIRAYKYAVGMGALLRKHIKNNYKLFGTTINLLLVRPIGGVLLGLFKKDLTFIVKNWVNLKGRLYGFLSYKQTLRNSFHE